MNTDDLDKIKLLVKKGASLEIVDNLDHTFITLFFDHGDLKSSSEEFLIEVIIASRDVLHVRNGYKKMSAYDYYIKQRVDILGSYHLSLLKGDIDLRQVKSARSI